ncbi:MAG: hypothetical protein ABJL44_15445 [Algibacter sp.]
MKIRKDRYYRVRGATTQLYWISCTKCKEKICIYQKDGKGNLFRLYADRLIVLLNGIKLKDEKGNTKKNLVCSCMNVLAVLMYYKRESRMAYRLIKGRIIKSKYYG